MEVEFALVKLTSWSIGDEDTVKVLADVLDGVVERQTCHRGTSGNETSNDVLLNTAINDCDVQITSALTKSLVLSRRTVE